MNPLAGEISLLLGNDLYNRVRMWVWLCMWVHSVCVCVCEGIDQGILCPHRAAPALRQGFRSTTILATGNLHPCSALPLVRLTQWGICASHKWSGEKVEQYSRGGGKLSVFSFFTLLFTLNLCAQTQLLPLQESHYFTLKIWSVCSSLG